MKKLLFIVIIFTLISTNAYDFSVKEEIEEIIEVYKIIESSNDEFTYQLYSEDLENMLISFLNKLIISLKTNKQEYILDFSEEYEKLDKEYKFLFKDYVLYLKQYCEN